MVLPAQPLSRVVVPHLGRLSRESGGGPSGQLPLQQALPGLRCPGVSGDGLLLQEGQPALQQPRRWACINCIC